jgi:hypothetical protein
VSNNGQRKTYTTAFGKFPLKGVTNQTPFTHEHSSVLGPLFQHSFGSDDHVDNLYVSNEDHASNPLDELIVFYINNNLGDSPQVYISFRELRVSAVSDSGSQVCILAEHVYEGLVETGLQILTLPLENVALITCFW